MVVEVLLKAAGDAPIMVKKKWQVDGTKQVAYIIEFIRKYIKCEPHDSLVSNLTSKPFLSTIHSKEKSIEGYRVIGCTVTTFVSRIHVGDHTHFCCDFTHSTWDRKIVVWFYHESRTYFVRVKEFLTIMIIIIIFIVISRMWAMQKVEVIPVVVGALRAIPNTSL